MQIIQLEQGRNRVAYVAGDDNVLDWLGARPKDQQGSAKGFKKLFGMYAEGTGRIPSSLFHYVDQDEGIYEFIKGRIRVLCFKDGGALLLLTHGYIKKSQKVDPQERSRAIEIRNRYLEAKSNGALEWENHNEQ